MDARSTINHFTSYACARVIGQLGVNYCTKPKDSPNESIVGHKRANERQVLEMYQCLPTHKSTLQVLMLILILSEGNWSDVVTMGHRRVYIATVSELP